MAAGRPAICVEHLTKRFGSLLAVDELSLEVPAGEIFGILGSNGAGKTTTLKVLTGLLRPDSGRVEVCGIDVLRDPAAAKRMMGFLPEAPALYDQLTGMEFLEMIGTLRGIEAARLDQRIRLLLETMELVPFGDRNIGTYSRGMRQKLAFASAVISLRNRSYSLWSDETWSPATTPAMPSMSTEISTFILSTPLHAYALPILRDDHL